MTRCTAPTRGHRSSAAAAACPACGPRRRGFTSYGLTNPSTYGFRDGWGGSAGSSAYGGGRASSGTKPRWSKAGSSLLYSPSQLRALTPIRESIEKRIVQADFRDVFLCHAWDDRAGVARQLHDLLEGRGVSVWFSEKDVSLGQPLLREIDRGLAKSRVGVVLVTPALLRRLRCEGIADKELSALLARDLLVPVVHTTTYEDLREVSPLLGSRSGLSTTEETMETIAGKLAELVAGV